MNEEKSSRAENRIPAKSESEVLTGNDVQELLNISRTTLWKLRREKNLPFSRVGRKCRYLRSEVMQWLKTQRGEAGRQLLLVFPEEDREGR